MTSDLQGMPNRKDHISGSIHTMMSSSFHLGYVTGLTSWHLNAADSALAWIWSKKNQLGEKCKRHLEVQAILYALLKK
jgi:hypothetical protein